MGIDCLHYFIIKSRNPQFIFSQGTLILTKYNCNNFLEKKLDDSHTSFHSLHEQEILKTTRTDAAV
jgi:hypothetical protein